MLFISVYSVNWQVPCNFCDMSSIYTQLSCFLCSANLFRFFRLHVRRLSQHTPQTEWKKETDLLVHYRSGFCASSDLDLVFRQLKTEQPVMVWWDVLKHVNKVPFFIFQMSGS